MADETTGSPESVEQSLQPVSVRMPEGGYARRFVYNLLCGFGQRAVQLLVSLFLIGYVLRRLGQEEWGLVILGTTVTTFLALLQLGAAAGIGKKLNTFLTRNETQRFQAYYTAGAILCAALTAVMLLGVAAIAVFFWDWMNVPAELAADGKLVLAAIGFSSACTSVGLPLVGCLQAAHRIDVNARWQSVGNVLRALVVVALFELLRPRAALYAAVLALINFGVLLAQWAWVRRHVPEARVDLRLVNRALLRDVLGFNLLTLFNTLNYLLFMQGPVLVLQSGTGLTTVGLYGIGLQLNNLMRGFLVTGMYAVSPLAVSLESAGRFDDLRAVFVLSTKIYTSVALTMWVWFLTVGDSFLRLWIGPDVGELIVALPWLMGAAAAGALALPADVLVVALERLRTPAVAGVLLGVGMIGTMFGLLRMPWSHPLVTVGIALLAFFGCYELLRFRIVVGVLRIGLSQCVRQFVLRPALAAGAAGSCLWAADRVGPVSGPAALAAATVAAGLVFLPVLLFATLSGSERERMLAAVRAGRRKEENARVVSDADCVAVREPAGGGEA